MDTLKEIKDLKDTDRWLVESPAPYLFTVIASIGYIRQSKELDFMVSVQFANGEEKIRLVLAMESTAPHKRTVRNEGVAGETERINLKTRWEGQPFRFFVQFCTPAGRLLLS